MIKHQIGASTLTLTEAELQISIPRSYWSKRQWYWLVDLLTQLATSGTFTAFSTSLAWVMAPTVTTTRSSNSAHPMPRWKHLPLDVLSYLLFVLLIPAEHPLHKLYAAIDWQRIDEECAAAYKNQRRGAPAYAPQALFRILVLMFYSGTPFESATLRRLQTDVAWRWFVGLSLLRPIPDASTLSYFRARLGVAHFEAILVILIQACDEAGLIGHLESYYDMTGVEASATQVTPYQRAVILAKAMSAYLDEAQGGLGFISREQIAAIALEVLQEKHPSLKKVSAGQVVASQDKLEEKMAHKVKGQARWWQRLRSKITALKQQLPGVPKVSADDLRQVARKLVPSLPQAFGNPDAAVGHTRTNGTICGYRSGFLVDAKHWIITAVIFVTLNRPEAPTVVKALDQHYALFQRRPDYLGLDSAFDRDEVHRYLEAHDIYGGITVRSRPGPAGVFHVDAFIWDERGQLHCPNGEVMEHAAGPYKDGTDRYRCTAKCAQCPLFNQCLTATQQAKADPRREIKTNSAAHQRAQRNRARSRSSEGRALRRRRFASEGLFGHVNRFHNGDKAPYHDGTMDHIAQLMVAFVSNLEKLAAYA